MATATSKTELRRSCHKPNGLRRGRSFLKKEKEFTRLRDELSRQRRELPWEKVEKQYVFEGPKGKETLADLFDGKKPADRLSLHVGPGWKEGCPSCSFLADTFDGAAVHLAQRDNACAVISRATLPEIEAFKKRMGWQFKWVSSFGTDFNFDYHVSFSKEEQAKGKVVLQLRDDGFPVEEGPGASVFYKNEAGEIFHTYSSYASRARHSGRRIQLPGPDAEGARRRRLGVFDGMGSPPRQVRRRTSSAIEYRRGSTRGAGRSDVPGL